MFNYPIIVDVICFQPVSLPSIPLNRDNRHQPAQRHDTSSPLDEGHIGALVLFDLSAAFNIADHSILIEVLRRQFGVVGDALGWLTDFLSDRRRQVLVGMSESDDLRLQFGVPQGSVDSGGTAHLHRLR